MARKSNLISSEGNNSNLHKAKKARNDEFYTQYPDIQREMNAYLEYNPDVFSDKVVLLPCDDPEWSNFTLFFARNFGSLGLRKLISTSYAHKSKALKQPYQPSLWEQDSPLYNPEKSETHGRLFILEEDINKDGKVDFDDLQWSYLEGDGDFRSEEVIKLRNEADIIITNPPFSLFRDFLAWIVEAEKLFVIIGSMNAITYKEVFPLIKDNKLWLGATGSGKDFVFGVPDGAIVDIRDKEKAERLGYKGNYTRLGNACWFSSIDHGRRHEPLQLMTMEENLKYGSKKIRNQGYQRYDNYDAIEVPEVASIPSDYTGVMGVPITFLDKYCPDQYKIIGATESEGKGFSAGLWNPESGISQPMLNGHRVYKRLFIKSINE